jgi:hypothetical protein
MILNIFHLRLRWPVEVQLKCYWPVRRRGRFAETLTLALQPIPEQFFPELLELRGKETFERESGIIKALIVFA